MKKQIIVLLLPAFLIWGCIEQDHDHVHDQSYDDHSEHQHEEDGHIHGQDDHAHENNTHDEDAVTMVDTEAAHDHGQQDYGVVELQEQIFSKTINCSGMIMNSQSAEVMVPAMHDGLIVLRENMLLTGREVKKNSHLLTISGEELVHDNILSGYQEALNAYQKAKLNYERGLELNKEKIISDREFQELRIAFENAENNFEVIRSNYSDGGRKVISPMDGYIKEIYITEGEFVKTGQALLKITGNNQLVIRADVPLQHIPDIPEIRTANFKTAWNDEIHHIEDMNGKIINRGNISDENPAFIPLYFEFENSGKLVAGSYIEVFLIGRETPGSIVVPKSALLEEAGEYYVFVQEGDEFVKHFIKLGGSDGENYRVPEGLRSGMKIATENVYQIRLAKFSGSLPQHSHSH